MKATLKEHLVYRLQNILAKGTMALLSLLGIMSIFFILLTALIVKTTPEGINDSFLKLLWHSLMRTLDPGTMGGDEGSWGFLLSMLFITLIGIFIISILIGIITTGIENAIVSLQKGRSKVVEKNHTLILGWNNRIMSVITELIIANNQYNGKFSIVILASRDKVEMEDSIKENIGNTGNTKIICRSGNATEKIDLELTNINDAKSIIILPSDTAYADIQIFKIILAIIHRYDGNNKKLHMVTEARYNTNIDLIKMVGENQVEVISPNEIIARIIAQTARQPGLAVLYAELLSFNGKFYYKDIRSAWYDEASGDEIYYHSQDELIGLPYSDAVLSYMTSSVIGVFNEKESNILNPSMDYKIQPDDKLILIAEDKEKIVYESIQNIKLFEDKIINKTSIPDKDNILIINWNRLTPVIISEIDSYAVPGSSITILSGDKNIDETINIKGINNCIIYTKKGDPTSESVLSSIDIGNFDNIIVVSDSDNLTKMEADSRSLITLLHLRRLCQELNKKPIIVSQILDEKHRSIAEETRADDFIVSEKIVGQCLTQISENEHLHDLLLEIFSAEGAEIYFKPITDYLEIDSKLNFKTLVKSGIKKGESVIGYKIASLFNDPKSNYGVSLNPNKNAELQFSVDDRVIVVATVEY